MNKVLKYNILAIFTLCLLSCRKTDVDEGVFALSFNARAQDIEQEVKAVAGEGIVKTEDEQLKDNPFGVYGVWNDTEKSIGGNNVFLQSTAQKEIGRAHV